jgi:hypothetical protein
MVYGIDMFRIRATGKLWKTVTVLGTLAVAAPAAALAEEKPLPPLVFEQGEPQVPLAPETRRAINRLLDGFVPAAVERSDPAAAYDLVTPALKAGDERRDWAAGDVPVPPYDARGTRFHEWMLRYSFPNEVDVQLILMPSEREPGGALVYDVNFKRVRGEWLIDAFMPEATFAREGKVPGMFSVRDVNPDFPAAGTVSRHEEPRLASIWFVVPGLLLLLPVAAGLAWAVRELRWNRRARAASAANELPDLPALGRRSSG